MSERHQTPEREQSHHRIQTIWGAHAPTRTEVERSIWSDEVVAQVRELQPDQLVVDSLPGGYFISYVNTMNPLFGEDNNAEGGSQNLQYLLGTDFFVDEITNQNSVLWEIIGKNDPAVQRYMENPNEDIANKIHFEIKKGFVQEGFSAMALTACALSYKRRNEKITRREFLRDGLATVGATIGTYFLRGGLYNSLFNSIHANTELERNENFSKVAKIVDPVFFESAFMDIRNIKAGLVAYDHERRVNEQGKEFTTGVIFGSTHSVESDPSEDEEKLLSKMQIYLKDIRESISAFYEEADYSTIVSELRNMFQYYISYDVNEGETVISGKRLYIESVSNLIDEIFLDAESQE